MRTNLFRQFEERNKMNQIRWIVCICYYLFNQINRMGAVVIKANCKREEGWIIRWKIGMSPTHPPITRKWKDIFSSYLIATSTSISSRFTFTLFYHLPTYLPTCKFLHVCKGCPIILVFHCVLVGPLLTHAYVHYLLGSISVNQAWYETRTRTAAVWAYVVKFPACACWFIYSHSRSPNNMMKQQQQELMHKAKTSWAVWEFLLSGKLPAHPHLVHACWFYSSQPTNMKQKPE
jgi:hypothetical protein